MAQGKAGERLTRAGHRVARVLRGAAGAPANMPVLYLADGDPRIDAMMDAVGAIAGGAHRFELAGLSLRDWPQTLDRTARAYATAKRPAMNALTARMKRRLYRAQYNWARAQFQAQPGAIALAWNGMTSTRYAYMAAAQDAGVARLYMERAPLPGRVTLDPAGVNWLASVPRSRGVFEDWAAQGRGRDGDGWRALRAGLVARASTRADVGQGGGADLPEGRFLFCPLQVPNDTQIRQFSGWVGSVEAQLRAMADAAQLLPDGWHLRLKEHPSSRIAFGPLLAELTARAPGRVIVDNTTDTFAQVAASAGVITVNSSVGLQAFFFDRPVLVLGQAFYGQPGLVDLVPSADAMKAFFAAPDTMGFDPLFRARFMNWLDQVYYPRVDIRPDGSAWIDPAIVAAKVAQARLAAQNP